MILKGSTEGKTYIGPGAYPGIEDREVVSFDGKVLILKWVNPEVAGRYASWCWRAVAPQRPSKSPRRDSATSLPAWRACSDGHAAPAARRRGASLVVQCGLAL